MKKTLSIIFLFAFSSAFAQGNWTLTGQKNRWGNGMTFSSKSSAQLAAFNNASDSINLQVNRSTFRLTFKYNVGDAFSDLAYLSDVTGSAYWQRSGIVLSPVTAGDSVVTSGAMRSTKNAKIGYVPFGSPPNNTDGSAIAIGLNAAGANTATGNSQIAIGNGALQSNTNADRNIAIGYNSLNTTTGSDNTAFGNTALGLNTTGTGNTAVGSLTMQSKRGSGNTAVGGSANVLGTAGNFNTYIGGSAGYQDNGSSNTIIGYSTGNNTISMNNITLVGAGATAGITTTNSSALGQQASITKDNQIVLGNGSITEVYTTGTVVSGGLSTSGRIFVGTVTPTLTSTSFLALSGTEVAKRSFVAGVDYVQPGASGSLSGVSPTVAGNGLMFTLTYAAGKLQPSIAGVNLVLSTVTATGGTVTAVTFVGYLNGKATTASNWGDNGAYAFNGTSLVTSPTGINSFLMGNGATAVPATEVVARSLLGISGSQNTITKFGATNTLTNSLLTDDGSRLIYNSIFSISTGGTLSITPSGAANNIYLGNQSGGTSYNCLSLTGQSADNSIQGIVAKSGDVMTYVRGGNGGGVTLQERTNNLIMFQTPMAGTGTRAVVVDASGSASPSVSDSSAKENIRSLTCGMDVINKLRPVSFEYKQKFKIKGEGRQIGFIAQEVMGVIPEVVFKTPSTGLYGINYGTGIFESIIVKGMQEQDRKILDLQDRIKVLEEKLDKLLKNQ